VFANDTVAVVSQRLDQIVVNPSGASVAVGQTTTLWATLFDARGNILTGRPVVWSSSNPSVATVSQTGEVTGVAPGSATISATSGAKSGSVAVVVTPAVVDRVEVTPPTASLTVGQTVAFTATALDVSNNPIPGRTFTWEAGDTSVIRVAPNGVATAVGAGLSYVAGMTGNARDSGFVEVTGATVTCLRPWAIPAQWFVANPYGRAVRARHGLPEDLATVQPGTISGSYFPLALGGSGASTYRDNIVSCSSDPVTLGAPTPLAFGNLLGPTIEALDSLFKLDDGATWDSTANNGLGGIVSSNAPPGAESPRVVLVGLYVIGDQSPGSSSARLRRTAWVFVDSFARETNYDVNAVKGDIVFRFLRFGP
jgi:hypothetical protein